MGAVQGFKMIEYKVPTAQILALQKKFEGMSDALMNKKIVETIALEIKEKIVSRTQTGKDLHGKAFKPYTLKYATKEGKTTVNLTNSGVMLNAISQKALSNDTAKIFFMTNESAELAKIHNDGEGNMPQRRFFGVGTSDNAEALRIYKRLAKQELARRGL